MKLLSRLSLFIPLFVFISLSGSAQCTQKISDLPAAPELLGFRLGMTKDQVKALVPQTKFGRTDEFGVTKTTINPFFDPTIDKMKFASVRSVSLDFLDEQLTSIWIGYDETYRVQVIEEFTSAVSKSFKLPNAWSPSKGRGQQMRCAGFQLTVTTVAGGPSFRLLDLSADDTIAERRAAKEERDAAAEATTEGGSTEDATVAADKKTKTYFPNGCQAAKTISGDNLVVFKTAEEAEKAGFKIAKRCN